MTYANASFVDGNLHYTGKSCQQCPDTPGLDCSGPGLTLDTMHEDMNAGYWRSHNLSGLIRRCPTEHFCVGKDTRKPSPGQGQEPSSDHRGGLASRHLLESTVTGTGVGCRPAHTGPYCELCVDQYVMKDGGCNRCSGSNTAYYVLGAMALVTAIMAYCCSRASQWKGLTDAAVVAVKTSDSSDFLSSATDAVKEKVMDDLATVVQPETSEALSERGATVVARPDIVSTPQLTVISQSASPEDEVLSPTRSDSAFSRACSSFAQSPRRAAAAVRQTAQRHGVTQRRVNSMLVKSRIIISLIQVITQLGAVFSIPYPGFYTKVVDRLGIFSLDFLDLLPLKCSVSLNHDHFMVCTFCTAACLCNAS